MRILSVTEFAAPFYEFGGPPVKVEALTQGLAARGHAVTVLTADWELEKRLAGKQDGGVTRRSPFGWSRELNGVQSIYLPTWLRYRATTWNPAATRYCRAQMAEFDVAHIYGLYDLLGPAVARECRKRKIPYVVEPMGMFAPIVRSILFKRIYRRIWGTTMLEGAAAIMATAEQEVEELLAGGIPRGKIVLRRNGVMPPPELPARKQFREEQKIPAEAQLILFLGRLSSKKSPDMLLEAFAQIGGKVAGREVWLVFAGPDESGMLARLQEQARKLGLSQRVVFSGPVYGQQKWQAYVDADVFVLPSQNENFGNTAAEAAVCGTPVVITENCGIAALLNGNGAIVVRHETAAVAKAVKEVLTDPYLRSRLASGGKQAAGKLGWEEPVATLEQVYTGLRRPARSSDNQKE